MDLRKRITELQSELSRLGYHSYQIREIIKETIGNPHLDQLTELQHKTLIEGLEAYVRFANQCRIQMR